MDFKITVIARGRFEDIVDGNRFIIDTATLRLNPVSLDAWHNTYTLNSRDCYPDGVTGDMEWNDRKSECGRNLERFHIQVKEALGIDAERAVTITQVISEVFAVAYIRPAAEK